ncbi:Peptide chain release factor 1, mitochondrial [Fusarium torreyae]|uniref:Peptide chain release factor 1, mitochondrial n=1 Tax=Fusarium torreyae TaxID=1237075 RepID=A0A9W8VHJ5_9HYPO|nr:Peptide chain release factor 1, mitochondrial [Fusarium torreyae]
MAAIETSDSVCPTLRDEPLQDEKTPDDAASTLSQADDPEANQACSMGDPGEPPDGGLQAWLQVLTGHLVAFNSWGYLISFGIFQPYYEDQFSLPPSTVSWVGSLEVCLIFFIGTFSGRAFDAGYYRTALAIGLFLQILSIFMTSIASEFWQVLLAQGICQGLGNGIIFAPTIANMTTYFTKKKTIAISAGACGAATGGMVFPLIAQQLLPKIGFRWTVRVMGLVVAVSSMIIMIIAKTRLKARKAGPLVEWAAFKEPAYVLFAVAMFFTLWPTWISYNYARQYSTDKLGGSASDSFLMLIAINAVGIPGRMISAFLADRYFGAINVFIPTIFSAALCLYLWSQVHTLTGGFVWVSIFGYFGAAIQSLFPSCCASLTPDLSKAGTRIGMIFTIISFAALTGSPLAGKLMQATGGSYLASQLWGGSSMILDASQLLAPALLQRAQSLTTEHDDLQKVLNSSFDSNTAKRVGELSRVAEALKAWETSQASVAELTTMIDDPEQDADLAAIARDELSSETGKLESLARKLSASLTPRHPFADFPCMIEFRPGPGGLEGRYFMDTLFKMYKGLCMRRGYRHSVVKYEFADGAGDSSSSAGENPLQEAILEVHDQGAFDTFRSEAGMHRVQRIPSTESKGRVHTSAVAVWVLPSFPENGASNIDFDDPESDFYVNPQEVKIETMRARGAGGQHVNKTESAIRMTHLPTGTTVSMQDHRSQQRNREEAWKLLRSRIADQRREAREEEASQLRNSVLSKTQITRGDKIRTYNYNQDRCTDHRAGVDVHDLPNVLEGGEKLDRIMDGAKDWLVGKDIELVMLEEEAKEKQARGSK